MDKDKLLVLSGERLNSGSVGYIEALHEDYVADPNSVPAYWQEVFKKLEPNQFPGSSELTHSSVRAALRDATHETGPDSMQVPAQQANRKQVGVIRLISAYRYLGHRQADIDPLSATARPDIPELNPEFHGLSHKDMDTVFETGAIGGIKKAPLREILNMLSVTYCGTIGSESVSYTHLTLPTKA